MSSAVFLFISHAWLAGNYLLIILLLLSTDDTRIAVAEMFLPNTIHPKPPKVLHFNSLAIQKRLKK